MDSVKTVAREDVAQRADLIGALRLPSHAFSRGAGTEVVTDLLIFRRREAGTDVDIDTLDWINTETTELFDPRTGDEDRVPINACFLNNPHRVLGTAELGHGLHESAQLTVAGATGQHLADQIRDHLQPMIAAAVERGHGLTARSEDLSDCAATLFEPGLRTHAAQTDDPALYTLRDNAVTRDIDYWAGHSWELNPPGESGCFPSWEGWGHVKWFVEEDTWGNGW